MAIANGIDVPEKSNIEYWARMEFGLAADAPVPKSRSSAN
ncbi:hypothetical protein CGRA01v4_04088 [Colletotrichum graminicola]|nr:hypothetical protein CGRA01v4_04088 [Colletotrichum graminicola]